MPEIVPEIVPAIVPAIVPKENTAESIITRELSEPSPEIEPVIVEEELTESEIEVPAATAAVLVEPTPDSELIEAGPIEASNVDVTQDEAAQVEVATETVAFEDAVLQFTFSGDCWVEVLDGNNTLIYNNLRLGGDKLGVNGLPPFNILLGDAANVQLIYRGEDFAIPRRPGRNTARFNVGTP